MSGNWPCNKLLCSTQWQVKYWFNLTSYRQLQQSFLAEIILSWVAGISVFVKHAGVCSACSVFLILLCFCCCVQRGETALHMAARAGQTEVVRYLVQNGAQVEAKAKVRTRPRCDKPGWSVLNKARTHICPVCVVRDEKEVEPRSFVWCPLIFCYGPSYCSHERRQEMSGWYHPSF